MIILGIDPGTATTGFGVIQVENDKEILLDFGCIQTAKNIPLATRLNEIMKDLSDIITQWKPDEMAIEQIFFSKNVKTAMSVAHARGAILQKMCESGYQPHEYTPGAIKEAVCGYGKAEKMQVQKMVKMILDMDEIPRPDDAADALAVAICHSQHARSQQLMTAT